MILRSLSTKQLSRFIGFFIVLMLVNSCATPAESENQKGNAGDVDPLSAKVATLTEQILKKPSDPNLYIQRSLAYNEQGLYNLAMKDIDRALKIDSTVSFIHAAKGEIYFKSGELREARLSLERAVTYDPSNLEALLKLGEVNYLLRRYTDAIAAIDKALRQNERQAKGYFLKGFIFKEVGDTARSLSSFQTATEVNPSYYEAFMELGHLHAYRGDPIALDYLNTALDLSPNSVEAYYHKGLFYQAKGEVDLAMDVYRELVRQDPNAFLGYYNLGYLYLVERQQFDSALVYFDLVLSIQPAAIDALYNKGLCFEEMGRKSDAVKTYKEVLQSDPQHTLAAMGLERLLE